MWRFFIVGVVGIILVKLLSLYQKNKRSARKTKILLQEIECKYEDYIQRWLDLEYSQLESMDISSLINEIMIIIKPEIRSIIAQINSADSSVVDINIHSNYFKSSALLLESMFVQNRKNKALSPKDEIIIVDAFKDAIRSDLTNRKLGTGEQDLY